MRRLLDRLGRWLLRKRYEAAWELLDAIKGSRLKLVRDLPAGHGYTAWEASITAARKMLAKLEGK